MENVIVQGRTSGDELMRHPDLGRLREAVGQVVGSVFFGTLLKQMRESPLRSELGHGGRGERMFEAQLDAEFADRAGQAGRNTLSVSLLERLAPQTLRIQHAAP